MLSVEQPHKPDGHTWQAQQQAAFRRLQAPCLSSSTGCQHPIAHTPSRYRSTACSTAAASSLCASRAVGASWPPCSNAASVGASAWAGEYRKCSRHTAAARLLPAKAGVRSMGPCRIAGRRGEHETALGGEQPVPAVCLPCALPHARPKGSCSTTSHGRQQPQR